MRVKVVAVAFCRRDSKEELVEAGRRLVVEVGVGVVAGERGAADPTEV